MMVITIESTPNVFSDNKFITRNTTVTESATKKKHVAICYHLVRKACADHTMRATKRNGKTNLAD